MLIAVGEKSISQENPANRNLKKKFVLYPFIWNSQIIRSTLALS